MRSEVEKDIRERLLAEEEGRSNPLRTDARVPVSAYTSAERATAERTIFRRTPLAIAHVSEVPDHGSFITRDIAGVPILLVRDDEGQVRVYANLCRHRGTRLVAPSTGHAKAFVYPNTTPGRTTCAAA